MRHENYEGGHNKPHKKTGTHAAHHDMVGHADHVAGNDPLAHADHHAENAAMGLHAGMSPPDSYAGNESVQATPLGLNENCS